MTHASVTPLSSSPIIILMFLVSTFGQQSAVSTITFSFSIAEFLFYQTLDNASASLITETEPRHASLLYMFSLSA